GRKRNLLWKVLAKMGNHLSDQLATAKHGKLWRMLTRIRIAHALGAIASALCSQEGIAKPPTSILEKTFNANHVMAPEAFMLKVVRKNTSSSPTKPHAVHAIMCLI